MSRADKRIPVTEETLNLIKDAKPEKMPYDLYIRQLMGVEDATHPAGSRR